MSKYLNCDLKPSEVRNFPWLYQDSKIKITLNNTGKWMLFFEKSILDEKWTQCKKLYNEKALNNVLSLKCSTNGDDDKKDGVIIFYCNNSNDECSILETGSMIIDALNYNENKFIYYKTDQQTRQGNKGESGGNYMYKLGTTQYINK